MDLSSFAFFRDSVSSGLRFVRPYQPMISTGIILGKLIYHAMKMKTWNREIRSLQDDVRRLRGFLNSGRLDASRQQSVAQRMLELQAALNQKVEQKNKGILTFSQVPSLFFAHPGANVYQGIHHVVNRTVEVRRNITALEGSTRLAANLGDTAILSAGVMSIAGTVASVAKMVGVIGEENHLGVALATAATIVHALEGVLLAKKFLFDQLSKVHL